LRISLKINKVLTRETILEYKKSQKEVLLSQTVLPLSHDVLNISSRSQYKINQYLYECFEVTKLDPPQQTAHPLQHPSSQTPAAPSRRAGDRAGCTASLDIEQFRGPALMATLQEWR